MKIKLLTAVFFLVNCLSAQNDLKDIFCVDTMFKVDKIQLKDIKFGDIVFDELGNDVVFTLSTSDNMELPVGIYNTVNKSYREVLVYIPKIVQLSERSKIANIRLLKEYLIIFYQDFYVTYHFDIGNLAIKLKEVTKLKRNYFQYFISKDNTIIGSMVYNTSVGEKVYLSKYKLFDSEPLLHIEPQFDCISLSHFSPNHWVDVNDDYIAFSQACDYKIIIYNHDLKEITQLTRDVKDWKRLSKDSAEYFNTKTAGEILKALTKINMNKISKIEGVWWLNNKTLMVRYLLAKEPISERNWDIYRMDENRAILTNSDIKDGSVKLNVEDTTTKCNFYLLSWFNECFIKNNKIIMLKPTANITYFGRKLKDVFDEQNKYMKEKSPFSGMWIYECNEKKIR